VHRKKKEDLGLACAISVKIKTDDEFMQAKPIPKVNRGKIDQKEYDGGSKYRASSPMTIIMRPATQIQWNLPKRSQRIPASQVPATNPTVEELNMSPSWLPE
jgi:hypothetical protein